MDIILETTKEIYTNIYQHNIALKKTMPGLNPRTGKHMLTGFYWPPWEKLEKKIQNIHLKRTSLLFYSNAFQPEPHVQHYFFVTERLNAGWTLSDERLDFIYENGEKIWIGHDPFLQDFRLCSDEFQEWCISRNKINELIVKKRLAEVTLKTA